MKTIILALLMLNLSSVYAHDEGHGPKLADAGKYGGLVSAVVLKSEAKKGASATLVNKAELVRSTDGTTRIYLYDTMMKPIEVSGFDVKGVAVLASKVKGKWKDTEFGLELKEGVFIGKMPKPFARPYNIDVTLKRNGQELLTAFDNLD